jgi:hypothetical protein
MTSLSYLLEPRQRLGILGVSDHQVEHSQDVLVEYAHVLEIVNEFFLQPGVGHVVFLLMETGTAAGR